MLTDFENSFIVGNSDKLATKLYIILLATFFETQCIFIIIYNYVP